ncbi:MFS transporter [Chloroflexota bacterium]
MSATATISPAKRERVYRSNFAFFLVDGILFTVALGMMGANTVIPDFIRQLTDSEILIGLSSSLFEIGWLLPQLFVARYLIKFARKKWWFVGPNIPVRFAMLAYGIFLYALHPSQTTLMLVGFLVCYGIAAVGDGIVGVPWVDLMGSSMDNRWRARLFGLMTGLGALLMLGVAPIIAKILSDDGPVFPNNYALIFGIAGILLALSSLPVLFLRELPGGKPADTVPAFSEFIPQLGRVLREDGPYRNMIITRTLTSMFAMATPFYIGFATESLGMSNEVAVPGLFAMYTVGVLIGALLYSWLGNRHNYQYLQVALLTAALVPICALLAGVIGPAPLYLGFFISGLALSSLFSAYLNWIIMYSNPDELPVYTGLFNTISAVTLLASPIIGGLIVQTFGYRAVFATALVMVLGAFFMLTRHVIDPQKHGTSTPQKTAAEA